MSTSLAALVDPAGLVVQVEAVENKFDVASPFKWVDCDGNTNVGMLYDGENFINGKVNED